MFEVIIYAYNYIIPVWLFAVKIALRNSSWNTFSITVTKYNLKYNVKKARDFKA